MRASFMFYDYDKQHWISNWSSFKCRYFIYVEWDNSFILLEADCHLRLNYKKKQLSSLNTKLKAVLERNGYEMYNVNFMMFHSHF